MKLPQLSLRELFLLVVIAAMSCGWWRDQARVKRIEAELLERSRELERRAEASDKVFEYLWTNYPDQRDKLETDVANIMFPDGIKLIPWLPW